MATFAVPTREQVSEPNQAIFDQLEKNLGFVPNLYAVFAFNPSALGDYLGLQNRKSTLTGKEREVINLTVSQVNDCPYCLAAHTALGKLQGFTEDEIVAVRRGEAFGQHKLEALGRFVRETTLERGKPSPAATQALLDAGYTQANLVDIVIVIGDKIITNYLHGITNIAVDFPAATVLDGELVQA